MKRETAYKIAIGAIEQVQRKYAFDHNLAMMYDSIKNEGATTQYKRYSEAIKILEAERDHKQLDLFGEKQT